MRWEIWSTAAPRALTRSTVMAPGLLEIPTDSKRRRRRRRVAAGRPVRGRGRDLPNDEERRAVLEQLIEDTIEAEGQRAIWWRDVPIDERHVGETAEPSAPVIRQVLIASDKIEDQNEFERKLYVIVLGDQRLPAGIWRCPASAVAR